MKKDNPWLIVGPLRRNVIAREHLPRGLGLHVPLLAALYLKAFDAPTWGWAVFWTLAVLWTLEGTVQMFRQCDCDPVLKEQKP